MIISRLKLKNWRNFQSVDIPLGHRAFFVGPNAAGKSNLLDAIRFLRDVAKPGGGLESAVEADRGGVSKIRTLTARSQPNIEIEIHLAEAPGQEPDWRYALGFTTYKLKRGRRRSKPKIVFERAWKGETQVLNRPNSKDKIDDQLLTQTHLQQISLNAEFRPIAEFLLSITYLHLVPQFLKHPTAFSGGIPDDPYGKDLLSRIAQTPKKTQQRLLKRIEEALRIAVPQLKHLSMVQDDLGIPHLEAIYEHWRPQGAKQREDQFSDGTLRLIGLLWALLETDSVLLLEEPELSLHSSIAAVIPAMIHGLTKNQRRKRQVIITTHSADLLSDRSISGDEVIVLTPGTEGTRAELASDARPVRLLLEGGLSIADAVLPTTKPKYVDQLRLF